jgi:hypothetical protein
MENSLSYYRNILLQEIEEKQLSPKQQKIAKLDPPSDELDAGDFAALRAGKKPKMEVDTPNPPTDYSGKPSIPGLGPIVDMEESEDQDHIKTRVGGIVFKKTGNTNGSKVEYQPYSLIDKKNVDTAFYYYPEDIQQRADDYTAPKGGTISTQFESEDHEVSMANNSLESIVKAAMELKAKMGDQEKDIPAWIQDHITNAANFISQAAENYHEYGDHEEQPKDKIPSLYEMLKNK